MPPVSDALSRVRDRNSSFKKASERLAAAYDLLIETSDRHPELQVILVDNEIPDNAREYVRLELSEEDRLIRDTHAGKILRDPTPRAGQ